MSDLGRLFKEQDQVARWKAESENATARLQIARMNENCAYLISQYDPVHAFGVDRDRLKLLLDYIRHGDLARLNHEFGNLTNG